MASAEPTAKQVEETAEAPVVESEGTKPEVTELQADKAEAKPDATEPVNEATEGDSEADKSSMDTESPQAKAKVQEGSSTEADSTGGDSAETPVDIGESEGSPETTSDGTKTDSKETQSETEQPQAVSENESFEASTDMAAPSNSGASTSASAAVISTWPLTFSLAYRCPRRAAGCPKLTRRERFVYCFEWLWLICDHKNFTKRWCVLGEGKLRYFKREAVRSVTFTFCSHSRQAQEEQGAVDLADATKVNVIDSGFNVISGTVSSADNML